MTKLIVNNLCKKYDQNIVVNNFNMEINGGEIVCLMGPSGVGKTTILNCITNLIDYDSGTISIDGISNKDKNYQSKIGLIFQNYNLFNNKTVYENCELALKYHKINGNVDEVLNKLKIFDKKDQYPSSLSGGQKQRVAIARLIVLKPSFLCFDEPTSALDKDSINDVYNIIKSLSVEGLGVLIVSHDENFVKKIADRIIKIEN